MQGKIAIVTGAAAGIGRALCLELARQGALVVAAGHHLERVEATVAAITSAGGQALAVRADVSSADDMQALIANTVKEHGHLDYLFNNAGISIAGEMRDLSLDEWRQVINVNLMGALHGSHFGYQAMLEQGFGHIVNISSLGGLLPFPVKAPYATTKHAIIGLSSTLRAEASGMGVKVSVVCPGLIATDIWDKTLIHNATNEEMRQIFLVPMMDVNKAAKRILRGVSRNKGIITFPFHAKLAWWAYRLWPPLLTPFGWYMMHCFRKVRRED